MPQGVQPKRLLFSLSGTFQHNPRPVQRKLCAQPALEPALDRRPVKPREKQRGQQSPTSASDHLVPPWPLALSRPFAPAFYHHGKSGQRPRIEPSRNSPCVVSSCHLRSYRGERRKMAGEWPGIHVRSASRRPCPRWLPCVSPVRRPPSAGIQRGDWGRRTPRGAHLTTLRKMTTTSAALSTMPRRPSSIAAEAAQPSARTSP